MLTAIVPLHDIRDSEAFVRSQLAKALSPATLRLLSTDERDELLAEGLRILTHLADTYEPGKGGRDPAGSTFTGYASKYLPGKLRDAHHRLQGTHHLVTSPDGTRQWQFDEKPRSLNELTHEDPDAADRHRALQAIDTPDGQEDPSADLREKLGRALDELYAHEREQALQVGELLGLGITPTEAAKRLGLRSEQLLQAVERIKAATPYLTTLEAT